MTRIHPHKLMIMNLQQTFPRDARGYRTREDTHAHLKDITGVDFGYDAATWESWLKANPEPVCHRFHHSPAAIQYAILFKSFNKTMPRQHADYLTVKHAYNLLKHKSGMDFGDSIPDWEAWLKENVPDFSDRYDSLTEAVERLLRLRPKR